ncbi:Uncharacterized protein TCM_017658 [Theobroma cacao]|uniref:Uncharacterized protein n=1 Tax=Theobroma cacao TaxID=3641 RepID=A0A061EDY3_THECC|nr:Uncharacterized protein TCM_017658 [Theobroma cacao]
MARTGKEQEDVEALFYVLSDWWDFNIGVNIHCKQTQLHVIREVLQKVNELEAMKKTCFGHLMDVKSDKSLFCANLVHNLMLSRINQPNAIEGLRTSSGGSGKTETLPTIRICMGVLVLGIGGDS